MVCMYVCPSVNIYTDWLLYLLPIARKYNVFRSVSVIMFTWRGLVWCHFLSGCLVLCSFWGKGVYMWRESASAGEGSTSSRKGVCQIPRGLTTGNLGSLTGMHSCYFIMSFNDNKMTRRQSAIVGSSEKNSYRPQTKLREGNVFTPICQSFCLQRCLPNLDATPLLPQLGDSPPPPPRIRSTGTYPSGMHPCWDYFQYQHRVH